MIVCRPLQHERRMALRVERSDSAEAAARARPAPRTPPAGPAYLSSIGTLKHYQVSGE